MPRLVAALAAALPAAALPAAAQEAGGWALGASGSGALWVGESDVLDASLGLDVTAFRRLAAHASLRLDGMLMMMDAQTAPSESADNRVFVLGVGPEADAALGRLTVYGRGLVGLAVNRQVRAGSAADERSTRALALGAGAGIGLGLSPSVMLDVGGDLLRLGELDFARTAVSGGEVSVRSVALRLRAGARLALR